MEYTLGAMLIVFLLYLYVETKRKRARLQQLIAEEKGSIAEASHMTASIGVFSPDTQTTVIVGASEDFGAFYYRMLRQNKVLNRSKINLANIARVDLVLNGQPFEFECDSAMPTTSLRATELAGKVLGRFSPEGLKSITRASLCIAFFSEVGSEKTLEITSLRANDERHRLQRVQLLKNSVWWTAFLSMAARQARHVRARTSEPKAGADSKSKLEAEAED